jgi:hypothetical protein
LERFLGNECGVGFIAYALGGEFGTRPGTRGRWDCEMGDFGSASRVGEGEIRNLLVGVLFSDVVEAGETGVGGSIFIFETVRVCKGVGRFVG